MKLHRPVPRSLSSTSGAVTRDGDTYNLLSQSSLEDETTAATQQYLTLQISVSQPVGLRVRTAPPYRSKPFHFAHQSGPMRSIETGENGFSTRLAPGTYRLSISRAHMFNFYRVETAHQTQEATAGLNHLVRVDANAYYEQQMEQWAQFYPYERHNARSPLPEPSVWRSWLQGALDIVGLIPLFGNAADIANALIHFAYDEYLLGTISLICCIDGIGQVLGGIKFISRLTGTLSASSIVATLGRAGSQAIAWGARKIRDFLRMLVDKYRKFTRQMLDQANRVVDDLLDAIGVRYPDLVPAGSGRSPNNGHGLPGRPQNQNMTPAAPNSSPGVRQIAGTTVYRRGNREFRFNTDHAAQSSHNGHAIRDLWPNAPISRIENEIADELNWYLNQGGSLPSTGAGKYLTTEVAGRDIGYHARWVSGEVRVTTYYMLHNR